MRLIRTNLTEKDVEPVREQLAQVRGSRGSGVGAAAASHCRAVPVQYPVPHFLWVARSAEMNLDRKKIQRVAFVLLPACLPAPLLRACPAVLDHTASPAAYDSTLHSLAPLLPACQALFDHIPVGVGSQGIIPTTAKDLEEALEMGMDWSLREVRGQ